MSSLNNQLETHLSVTSRLKMTGTLSPFSLYALIACVGTSLPLPCVSNVNEYCQMIQGNLYSLIPSLVLTAP